MKDSINFTRISAVALSSALPILNRWLPSGRMQAHEYVALNPMRSDKSLGSFRINIVNGKWADFATGDRGGDFVSLGAYLFDLSQIESAKRLSDMLGGVK